MSLNPLWEVVTPQCAPFKWYGTLSQCYSSPTLWVALGTAVLDLFCVEPGPILCLMGRIRNPTQGAGRDRSCGALVGSQFRWSHDVTWSDRLKGNVSVTYVTLVPWRRERRRHVPFPQLLNNRWVAGSPARWINAVHLLPLILMLWSAAAGCELLYAKVHWLV